MPRNESGNYGVTAKKILVKVHSASLNPIDLVFYNSSGFLTSLLNSEQGPGWDFSGTIVAIGEIAKRSLIIRKEMQSVV